MGSFANVVIHRVPRRISIVTPRSRCPYCLTELSWTDNIPVVFRREYTTFESASKVSER